MTGSLLSRIQDMEIGMLTPIIQRATGCSGPLTRWENTPIKVWLGGLGPSVIYRYSGGIQNGTEEIFWSLILKVISTASHEKGSQLKEPYDRPREYEFYRSDLSRQFPEGFMAAHCYDQEELVNEAGLKEYWLWLEDLAPNAKKDWSLENHYQAAKCIGKFNGVWMNRPLPAASWMKYNHVRQYLEGAAPSFQRLFRERDQPILRRLFPPAEVDSLAELWQRREENFKILQRLPQTFCHGDAQVTNLFLINKANGDVETAAIDWEGAGLAAIGMDAALILLYSIYKMDENSAPDLDQALFQGYLEGLRAIGWRGDPRMVRLGYISTIPRI